MSRRLLALAVLPALALIGAACGGGASDTAASAKGPAPGPGGAAGSPSGAAGSSEPGRNLTLRLGFFPNVTHATALVGIHDGIFADHLGAGVTLRTQSFNAGPSAIEALFAGALDAAYLGPNPAINGHVKSKGQALRVVSGATSGGAFFVVRSDIERPEDLKGRKVASPQLGGTQDVALRAWLQDHGLHADTQGGGDVSIVPQDNAQTLAAFASGAIDGAWVPEPWATRLVREAGAKVLVDERDLWPGGQYVTTHLVVATSFLDKHPDVVKLLLEGQVAANDYVNSHPAEAQRATNDEIEAVTGKRLDDEVVAAAWGNLTFTDDPIAASLEASAQAAEAIDLLDLGKADLAALYDLGPLNDVLRAAGKAEVAGP
jgi:NitT/TauT family transport system substrate-binding protein